MQIGKYVLRYLIGRGGMAEVWAADELGPEGYQNPVAIKLPLDELASDREALMMFLQEATTATSLRHGNLVSTFGLDRTGPDAEPALRDRHYLVMERIEGADLARMLALMSAQGHSCPQKIAAFIIAEVLRGLSYVHTRKDTNSREMHFVHRDVSPQNILITYSGEVKISDFGVAKSMRSKHTGSIRGKIAYFSPEILNGEPPSPASDQFGVGIVLWELLAGRALFADMSDTQAIAAIIRCEIPSPGRPLAPGVEAFMRRMLSKDPRDRFPSTAAALEAAFKLEVYQPNGAPLGKLLASLLPDRDRRWTPEIEAGRLIEQLSVPIVAARDYPDFRPPSLGIAIDLSNSETVPLSPMFAGKGPFQGLTDEAWAEWWRKRGVNRDNEIYGAAERIETKLVPRPPGRRG